MDNGLFRKKIGDIDAICPINVQLLNSIIFNIDTVNVLNSEKMLISNLDLGPFINYFVELGGGVDDMRRWCRDGVCVELGFRR